MTTFDTSLVSCGFLRQSTGITGRNSTKEVRSATTVVISYRRSQCAARRQGKADGMKTIAIRLEDETSDLLGLVAQLEGTSQIEQIRDAIASHLERKVAGGELTVRAQEALDEVERDASAKRKAIEQLVNNVADNVRTTKATGRRRSSGAKQGQDSGEQ
jgi:predicted DNA-binding protein